MEVHAWLGAAQALEESETVDFGIAEVWGSLRVVDFSLVKVTADIPEVICCCRPVKATPYPLTFSQTPHRTHLYDASFYIHLLLLLLGDNVLGLAGLSVLPLLELAAGQREFVEHSKGVCEQRWELDDSVAQKSVELERLRAQCVELERFPAQYGEQRLVLLNLAPRSAPKSDEPSATPISHLLLLEPSTSASSSPSNSSLRLSPPPLDKRRVEHSHANLRTLLGGNTLRLGKRSAHSTRCDLGVLVPTVVPNKIKQGSRHRGR